MQINGFQVCDKPLTYVLDTPGIMMPAVPSDEVGLKLVLAGDTALNLVVDPGPAVHGMQQSYAAFSSSNNAACAVQTM
jgi:ribosome biogenesis GTPase A